jgi:hypothetical protein
MIRVRKATVMADKSAKKSPLETAGGAYVGYRRAGRRPESQQDRQASANIPVAVARGFISGTLGMPGDIESLARLPYELITGKESPTILPTSEDIEKRLPFRGASQTPVGQFFTGASQLAGGAYTGPLSGARAAMAVPRAVTRAGKDFVQASGQSVSPLTVYHGSPHKFEKFDSSKIGTGEGAQAYGHGLYLAESPEVAKGYQSRLSSDRGFSYKGKAGLTRAEVQDLVNAEFGGGYLDGVTRPSGVADSIIDDMVLGTQRKTGQLPRQYKEGSERAELYKRLKNEIHHADPGSLYTVDLPDEKIARMLDWDKPLSEQPEVIKALKGTDYEVGMSQREAEKVADMRLRQEADEWAEMTGGDPVDYSNNVDWEKYVDQVRKESGSIDSSITGKDLHRMVMRDEGYRPDLFDTENYQVGTSEAMRGYGIPGIKYLDATSRDAGKGTRNFVVFPGEEDALTILERKKEGGKVSMSDNPDAQMMEVMDKKLAGGGLLKGLKTAAKAAKAEPSLPLNLPRAAPKTKEEIRPVAQRMAQQMTGEFVRPDPKKSINPAGKSLKQFQMERELSHDIRPTEGRTLLPQEVADIEKQLGMLKIGVSGDTTIADKTLYRAGPYELDLPSPQYGGPLYGLGGEGAWASNNPVAATFQKRVQELSQANKDAPVLGQFLAMGPQGSNFALHFADANLRAIDPSKMNKRQIEQFNELIRKGSEKSGPRPGFPGIEDKESAYLHFAFDPELRKHFNAMMQLPKYTEKLGLPDGRVILHAITEPELRNTEVLTSGLSQMRLDPSVNPADLLMSAHPTYSHVIPKVPESAISRTRYPVPAELEFPDVAEFIKKEYRPRDATRVYQTATPRQMVDPQHIDEMKMYEELMKEYTGKKAGGEIKMQAGGLAKLAKALKGTQEVLPAAEREANLAKMLESSKVKDRLYHGTGADISEFKPSVIGAMGPGTYLTKNPKVASEYGNVVNLRRSTNQPNVLPVYAQIKNPFEITRVNRSGSELFNRFDPSGKLTDEEVIERVKKAGYDAIHALEEGEINVLDPRKIKSAIGNRGTYNTSKPEINEAIGGLIKVKNKRKAKA